MNLSRYFLERPSVYSFHYAALEVDSKTVDACVLGVIGMAPANDARVLAIESIGRWSREVSPFSERELAELRHAAGALSAVGSP